MSVVGIANLAERLLNHTNTPAQDTQPAHNSDNRHATQAADAAEEDHFTPSAQTGQGQGATQEAGLFSVSEFSFFSAAADFFLGQGAGAQPNPAPAATPATAPGVNRNAATAPAALPTPAAATAQNSAPANPANTPAPSAPIAATAPAADAAPTNAVAINPPVPSTAQGSPGLQQQLQTLNQSLVALGLDPQEIQQLDQIASVINDFDPLAFTSLAYQLEELAQLTAPQTAAQTAGNAPVAANNTAANNTNAAQGNAGQTNGGGFQVQELVIRFTGIQAQGNVPSNANENPAGTAQTAAGNNATFQLSAFKSAS